MVRAHATVSASVSGRAFNVACRRGDSPASTHVTRVTGRGLTRPGTLARVDLRAVMSDVSGLGPFFTVRTDPAEAADPSWRPFADLETEGPALRERISYVRGALGDPEPRVAASIAFQGIAAVIVSPPFAAAALHSVVPALGPSDLHWRPMAGGPFPLWTGPVPLRPVPALAGLYDEHLPALVDATRAVVPVSAKVLWGNVASVVAGAASMIARARPEAGGRAFEVAAELLGTGPLAGTGDLLAGRSFRRRSCCLFYRVPGGGTCGDCILTGPGPRRSSR